jgi:glyoxylase-like metal-dependent hydrolase (beta-lactamase superfamily II)
MLKIGQAQVTRIEEYLGPAFRSRDLLPDFDPRVVDEHRKWLVPDHYDEVNDQLVMSSHSWVVRVGGKVFLVDTCIGNGKSRPGIPLFDMASLPYRTNLESSGLRVEEVDYVLCTHLHVDHVGWNTQLVDGQWVPTFPNAKYVFSKADHEFFDATTGAGATDEITRNVYADSVLPVIRTKQDLQVDGDHDLGYGITVEPAPGHSPGHVLIRLGSSGMEGLFTGDILHHPIQIYRPEWSSSSCSDPELARRTRRALLERAAERGSFVMPAHFGGEHACRIARTSQGFALRQAS